MNQTRQTGILIKKKKKASICTQEEILWGKMVNIHFSWKWVPGAAGSEAFPRQS